MPAAPVTPSPSPVLHAIALFEAIKGLAVLAASLGLLSLMHHDLRALAYALIGHFHLDPDAHYPRMLLDEARWLQQANLREIVLFATAYAALSFTEAYGLWQDRRWAEGLAAGSGAIYLPIEISHLLHHPAWANACVLALNVVMVAYMVARLWRTQKSPPPAELLERTGV